MNNVVSLQSFKKKTDLEVIQIGDLVEWQDYNGMYYEGTVHAIYSNSLVGSISSSLMTSKQTNYPSTTVAGKDNLSFVLDDGLTVIGSCVRTKLLKKRTQAERIKQDNDRITKGLKK